MANFQARPSSWRFGIEEISPEPSCPWNQESFFRSGGLISRTRSKAGCHHGDDLGGGTAARLSGDHQNRLLGWGLDPGFGTVAVLTVAAAVADPIIGCITQAAQAVRDCSLFLISFIPAFAGVLTAGGQPVTATTYNPFLFGTCQVAPAG